MIERLLPGRLGSGFPDRVDMARLAAAAELDAALAGHRGDLVVANSRLLTGVVTLNQLAGCASR